jgi:hypothetical protein
MVCNTSFTSSYCLEYFVLGRPCDKDGNFLPPDAPPTIAEDRAPDDWTPYGSRVEFETADFIYHKSEMSAGNINILMDLWAATLLKHGDAPPFANTADLYDTIDSTPLGDIPWQSMSIKYGGPRPDANVPNWMTSDYEAWFRDPHLVVKEMLRNPNFESGFDFAPTQMFTERGVREYRNFMSGDWAWEEAVYCSLYVY